MKRTMQILIAAVMLLSLFSCHRRPLTTADYTVRLDINIDRDIVNYEMPRDPEIMRVAFYDHNTGQLFTQAFLPPTGGEVNIVPERTYDILVYNFDTEVTLIKDENDWTKILATTNTISDAFKSKLKSRGTKSPMTDADADKDEEIVYDPDHLFVGRLNEVNIPARSVDSPEITLRVDCKSVVQTWLLEVNNIKGAQYVASISAVITGLSQHHKISRDLRSKEFASVFFDIQRLDRGGILMTKFNTFGMNPEAGEKQILSLVITDTGGKSHIFNVDVSDQFPGNDRQYILVNTDEIDIPEPEKKEGGGLAPSVDEWKDIVSNITI